MPDAAEIRYAALKLAIRSLSSLQASSEAVIHRARAYEQYIRGEQDA